MSTVVAGNDQSDTQLSHCFEGLHLATSRIKKSNFLHNFASAAFHLCYMLKVHNDLLDCRMLTDYLAGKSGFAKG